MNHLIIPAYIDPMAGSLVLQSILAGIIGGAVLLRGYLFRMVSFLTGWKSRQPQ